MRTKLEIVLRALLDGQEIEIDGRTYGMSEDYDLLVQMYRNDEEPFFMTTDCSLKNFIKLCEEVGDDEATIIACNSGLRSLVGKPR
jgi:hypothetical protein